MDRLMSHAALRGDLESARAQSDRLRHQVVEAQAEMAAAKAKCWTLEANLRDSEVRRAVAMRLILQMVEARHPDLAATLRALIAAGTKPAPDTRGS